MNTSWLNLGKVLRPHGIKGALKIKYDSAKPLQADNIIQIQNTEYKIIECQAHGQFYLIKLEDINTIEECQKLISHDIYVAPDKLADDEYTIESLTSLDVFESETDTLIGKVLSVENLPQQPVFRIRQTDGNIFMIPFIFDKFIDSINIDNNRIYFLQNWQLFV